MHSIKNDELEKAVLESVKVQIGLIIDMKRIKDQIEENYKELQNLDKMSTSGEWIEYFEKYQNVNSLSRELIDGLIDDIYVYEDKKIKVKFKYEDEYNYLIQYIKRISLFLFSGI